MISFEISLSLSLPLFLRAFTDWLILILLFELYFMLYKLGVVAWYLYFVWIRRIQNHFQIQIKFAFKKTQKTRNLQFLINFCKFFNCAQFGFDEIGFQQTKCCDFNLWINMKRMWLDNRANGLMNQKPSQKQHKPLNINYFIYDNDQGVNFVWFQFPVAILYFFFF